MSTTPQLVGPYERLMLVKAVSLSGQPPAAALGALARQAEERHFDAGATIIAATQPWEGVHIVVEGEVSVYEFGARVYSAGPGETFGRVESLARVAGGLEARADVDTLTLSIKSMTWHSILEDHYVMTQRTIQTLARMLLATPTWLSSTTAQRIHVPATIPPEGLSLVDRIRMLRLSHLIEHARIDSLAEIAAEYDEFRSPPATVLWRAGEPGGWFLVLLNGRIDSRSASGLQFSWMPGTVPGVHEALAASPRWHDAVAATPIAGLRLSAERLFDAMEDDFAMAADVLSALATRVRDQRQTLIGLPQPDRDRRD